MSQNNKAFGLYIYFFAFCTYIILNVHVCLNPSRGDRCYVRGGKSANCYTADLWTWFPPHFRFSSATLVVLRGIPLRLLNQVSDTITETIPTERDLCVKWQDPNCYQKHESRPRRSRVESSWGGNLEQARIYFQSHDWICNWFWQYIWGNKCKNSPHERLQSETFLWMRLAFLIVRRVLLCYLTKKVSLWIVSITLWDTENNNVSPSEAKTSTLTVGVAPKDHTAAVKAGWGDLQDRFQTVLECMSRLHTTNMKISLKIYI